MRNRRVSLLDLGLDDSFNASMVFVQSTIESINAGEEDPYIDIDFVRTRDPRTILSAFVAPCDVLHVMGHGDSFAENPLFTSSDGKITITLSELGDWAVGEGRGISAGVILADGCRTATGVWQKAVRDCLQGEVTYIGTTSMIGWHDSTVFCSAFYGAMFRNRGRGVSLAERAIEAAEKAIEAYMLITERSSCPYRAVTLKPNRRAQWAFGT